VPSPSATPCSVEITYSPTASIEVSLGAVCVGGESIGGLPVVLTSPVDGDLLQLSVDEWVNIPVSDLGVASLSTSASTGISSLSTGLSTTDSTVTSLSTSASSGVSSLSTGLSAANSGITSLSTAIGGGQTPLTFNSSGGTAPTNPLVRYTSPEQFSLLGVTTTYSGAWVNTTIEIGAIGTATTFEYTNLEGFTNFLSVPLNVVTLNLPALKAMSINSAPGPSHATLQVINFSALEYAVGLTIGGRPALTTVNLPSIIYIGSISATNNPALSSFTIGGTLKAVSGNVLMTSGVLDQASVDNILVRLAALDGTNGTALYENKTVTITGSSSAPSATGLTAKSTLVARGCTVTNN
jgi:hypothetical protein